MFSNAPRARWTMRRLGLVLLILPSVVAGYALCEVAVRAASAIRFPKMMELDDVLGWRHTRDAAKSFASEDGRVVRVSQNAFGHRGREFPLERTPSTTRVLVIGDSFTEAVHVTEDEIFTERLMKHLPSWELLNAAVGGYGTVQELLYLRSEGLQWRPDIVLVMVFENDFEDNCLPVYIGFGARPYARLSEDGSVTVGPLEPSRFDPYLAPVPFASFLHRHSLLFYLINSRVYQPLNGDRIRSYWRKNVAEARRCPAATIMTGLVDQIVAAGDSVGASTALALIPTKENVLRGTSFYGRVRDHCRARGLPCLDLLHYLDRRTNGGLETYFQQDIHWTAQGHAAVAEALAPFLAEALAAAPAQEGVRPDQSKSQPP